MSDAIDPEERPQDPTVEQLRPDPSQPPQRAQTLNGLWGDSDRPGFRRLYFSTTLSSYAEFRTEDVLTAVEIPPQQPPFLGVQATRVTLRHGTAVDITQSRRIQARDEFDLDVRLRSQALFFNDGGGTDGFNVCLAPATPGDVACDAAGVTPGTCVNTCETCPTNCGPFTCPCDTHSPTVCGVTCADTCPDTCGCPDP